MSTCPECGHSNVYFSHEVAAGNSRGPNFLPGLEGIFSYGKLTIVVCEDCGLTRFYASGEARKRLSESHKWQKQ